MRRISLCLLIVIASASVGAREVKRSSPNDESRPDTAVGRGIVRKPASPRASAPTEPRARPSVHSDVGIVPRSRWHSFLPGMFR